MVNRNFFENFESVYIIAEIGVNHNGDINLAKKLIDKAKESGASAVKFQSYKAEKLANTNTPKVKYQKINSKDKKESHFQMLKKYELSVKDHFILNEYCNKICIDFLSTPYDVESAKLLNNLNVKLFKVASADIVDFQLHKYISTTYKPTILSTGMSSLEEIKMALNFYNLEKSSIILLHCVSSYPCSLRSLNLNSIKILNNFFDLPVGFSDHSTDSSAACLATALSSKIIEKHLTLDKNMQGPDHKASSTPEEFANLVKDIRKTEMILGKPVKAIQEEELEMRMVSRKGLYLSKNVKVTQKVKEEDFELKRPGLGISPLEINTMIGKSYRRDLREGDLIKKEDIF